MSAETKCAALIALQLDLKNAAKFHREHKEHRAFWMGVISRDVAAIKELKGIYSK